MTELLTSATIDTPFAYADSQKRWRPVGMRSLLTWYDLIDRYVVWRLLLPLVIAWASLLASISIVTKSIGQSVSVSDPCSVLDVILHLAHTWKLMESAPSNANSCSNLEEATLLALWTVFVAALSVIICALVVIANFRPTLMSRYTKAVWECVWPIVVAGVIIAGASAGSMFVREAVIQDLGNAGYVALGLFLFSAIVVFVIFVRNVSTSEFCKRLAELSWVLLNRTMPLIVGLLILGYCWPYRSWVRDMEDLGRHAIQFAPQLLFFLMIPIAFFGLTLIALLKELPQFFYAGLGGGLTIATVTFNLGSELVGVFNFVGAQYLGWHFTACNLGSKCNSLEPASTILGTMLGVVTAGTVTATASEKLGRAIDQIRVRLGLTERQQAAAIRLRHPAREAIPSGATLSQGYPQEIPIRQLSKQKRFPMELLGESKGTRIKLMISPGTKKLAAQDQFSADWVHLLSQSARVVFDKSLFFVCSEAQGRDVEVVCYGSGEELCELSEMGAPFSFTGLRIDDSFYDALNSGEAGTIRAIVEEARLHMLRQSPHRDLLLTTVTQRETDELWSVLQTMGQNRISRVLLVSREGYERSILGAAEISSYLSPTSNAPSSP